MFQQARFPAALILVVHLKVAHQAAHQVILHPHPSLVCVLLAVKSAHLGVVIVRVAVAAASSQVNSLVVIPAAHFQKAVNQVVLHAAVHHHLRKAIVALPAYIAVVTLVHLESQAVRAAPPVSYQAVFLQAPHLKVLLL